MQLLLSFIRRIQTSFLFQTILFCVLALIAFYKIFSFWFFHGWETSWYAQLTSKFTLMEALQSHGLIAYVNFTLFGWRPIGWFATALLFHVLVALMISFFISKKTNRTVGIISGLLFLITTAHHDVVTWGTFESLYAVQTLCIYAGLWLFDIYMQTRRQLYYMLLILVFVFSFVIRESALLYIPLVCFFDIFFYTNVFRKGFTKQRIFSLIKRHGTLWLLGIAFLLFRASYGGAANDFIDERIQYSILLLHEHRYGEYFIRGLLSFGYFMGPYLIPYPIVNFIRDLVVHVLPFEATKVYFYTSFGWICYGLFIFIAYTLRKSMYSAYVWFSLCSLSVITAFYSFAWTVKDSFLATPYFWSENRWRYLGFTFFAAGMAILARTYFTNKKFEKRPLWWRKPALGTWLLGLYIVVNTLFLWDIENKMFKDNSAPAKLFYQTFLTEFPTLTSKETFYAFPSSPGIGDFFSELNITARTYYPNLSGKPDPWVRTELYYILRGMQAGEDWTQKVNFVDFDLTHGTRNRTQQMRTYYASLATRELDVTAEGGTVSADLKDSYPVDFRYKVEVGYSAFSTTGIGITEKTEAVAAFSKKLASLISDARINVCKTVGPPTEPNYDYRKELVLDGNLSYRSFWWADCRPAWLVVDMGASTVFSGAAWASVSKADAVPRNYQYDVSEDGITWVEAKTVSRNTQNSRIDVFSREIQGRYIRFWVEETSYRQLLSVNEFAPLFPETIGVSRFYASLPELYRDVYTLGGSVSWLRLTWMTHPDNTVPDADRTFYTPIIADGAWHRAEVLLPDSDYFSNPGQFLRRRLTGIRLGSSPDTALTVDRIIVSSPFIH